MTLSRKKIAEVLDALADYIEENELQKHAATKSQRDVKIDKLATSYEQTTGENFPTLMREKLSSLDTETLDHLVRTARAPGESPETLGAPMERTAGHRPLTVKEAAQQAEEQFLAWLSS